MAPSCPNSTLRVLISILLLLLTSTTTLAFALPNPNPNPNARHPYTHELLDPRNALPQPENALNSKKEPQTFFKDLGNFLGQYDGFEILRYLFDGIMGKEEEEGSASASSSTASVTTTVYVTPTPVEASSLSISTPTSGGWNGTATGTGTGTGTGTTKKPKMSILPIYTWTSRAPSTSRPPIPTNATTTARRKPDLSIYRIYTWSPDFSYSFPPATRANGTMTTAAATPTSEQMFSILPVYPTSSSSARNITLHLPTDLYVTESFSPPTGTRTGFHSYSGNGSVYPNPTASKPLTLTNPLRPSIKPNTTAAAGNSTTTTRLTTRQSTRYITVTVTPSPVVRPTGAVTGTSPASSSHRLPLGTSTPRYPNTTFTSFSSTRTSSSSLPTLPSTPTLLPFSSPPSQNTSYPANALTTLRRICANPNIRTITLPLLSRFYGPSAYPSLHSYPGCSAPNPRQALQAPGLLNCSALGAVVQECQRRGRRVLLGVTGDAASSVGGDLSYGAPAQPSGGFPVHPPGPYFGRPRRPQQQHNGTLNATQQPNLFDARHPPTSFALTLFSLFGEGHTERADLRPLGPETPSTASPDGIRWVARPLGEEVVVDGFDIRLPREWKGTYQAGQFQKFARRLRELIDEAWREGGGMKGGVGDLGADGKGVVLMGWA
ncbi:glycoside hydrolase family 18 protein [Trematosphaeria pertusa]|uniref:Glycoside hydrolase family 18 protein n=1 Tax=Trematosphaeria pertusa TaxID=390896 RepID=A0A6A6I8F2_9PLEO|nr:glycoside hydrolase family 18 protein [Trematosphaeria pertusa]KAF2246835.1 glycoside hydrolase family 18 protein [Trematosphaeria pertusa]